MYYYQILNMFDLLKIQKSSIYLQNILEDEENIEKNIGEKINVLLKQSHEQLKLNITYEIFIEYLLNLINNYVNTQYTEENILQYIILSDYFQLNIQDEFFNFVIDKYIFKQNIFYNELYLYNPINYYILDKFSKTNDIDNNTFKYIFEINENICCEIKILNTQCIEQNLLNKCVNIVDLNIFNNSHVNDVNHLQQLEKLNISCGYLNTGCGVDQNGISKLLFVKVLNVWNNRKITDVNHLLLLENLNISSSDCGVDQNGISALKFIKILDAMNNCKITCINHMQLLEDLNVGSNCCIGQNEISQLKFIKKLNVSGNNKISDVNHLQQLEELNISGMFCGVDQNGISQLRLIRKLNANYNNKITNIDHLLLLDPSDKYKITNDILYPNRQYYMNDIMHVLKPQWHTQRMEQVIGRVIRQGNSFRQNTNQPNITYQHSQANQTPINVKYYLTKK